MFMFTKKTVLLQRPTAAWEVKYISVVEGLHAASYALPNGVSSAFVDESVAGMVE